MSHINRTITWTDQNLSRLFSCCLYPEAYELPDNDLSPVPAGPGAPTRDPEPKSSPGNISTSGVVTPPLNTDNEPQPPEAATGSVRADNKSCPWARSPWQQEIFRSYLRVSKGLPPTGPLYANEEEMANARTRAWSCDAVDLPVQSDQSPWFKHIASIVLFAAPETGGYFAQISSDLAELLTNQRDSYLCPLAEVVYDFSRLKYISPRDAERYLPEWEYVVLTMKRRVADLEWRGYGGDLNARDHACICSILLNSFQTVEMDICGISMTGVIIQWEAPPTTSTFPVTVWFLVSRTGVLFRLTMSAPFPMGEIPVARAFNGTMAFQEVEQGPDIFQLLGNAFHDELSEEGTKEQYLSFVHLPK